MNRRPSLLTPVASLACSTGALAQSGERPYYVGIKQDLTHESNVLNGPSGSETTDTVATTTLLGGLNIPLGRQRFYANAPIFHQAFNNVSACNNDGYNLATGLDLSTIERLSGGLSLNSYRHQSDVFVGGIVPVSVSNIERSDDATARVRLGVDTLLGFDASLGWRQVSFSAPEYAAREYHQNSGSVGVSYRPSGILSLGAGVSGQRTTYVSAAIGQTAPDKSSRQDVNLTANWVPTGASTIDARINIGKIEYELTTALNFSGLTGSLAWLWKPTGLLALTTTLARDTGQEAGLQRLTMPDIRQVNNSEFGQITQLTATDFSRDTDSVQVRAAYDLTGKVKMNAAVGYARRSLVDGFSPAWRAPTTRRRCRRAPAGPPCAR